MKVILSLKDWKNQNVENTWNAIITTLPPYYRGGYTHTSISQAFAGNGSLTIDFGDSKDVAKKFIGDMAVDYTNIFHITKEK